MFSYKFPEAKQSENTKNNFHQTNESISGVIDLSKTFKKIKE